MNKKTENELCRLRAILSSQRNKNCLGTAYPADPDQCAPWPIVDEVIDSLTRIIEDQGDQVMSYEMKTRIIQLSKQGLTANLIFTALRHEFPSESYRSITNAIDDLLGDC